MNFTIRLIGDLSLPEFQKTLDDLKKNLMSEVRTQVSGRTPIDTGRARRGWQQRSQSRVENTVPYIGRLEKGYSRQAPNGFVKQGISAAVGKFNRGI